LHRISAPVAHADPQLRPVIARVGGQQPASSRWVAALSSCTPAPRPLPRERTAGPPVWCDRVPKGQWRTQVQFQKIKKRKKGIGRSAGKRRCLSPAPGMRSWRGSPPIGGALSRTLPRCAPHIAKSETPAMTRPVAAGIAHTGRTAASSGPASARVGCGRFAGEGPISKNKAKRRLDRSSCPPRVVASALVDPFCSLGNESIPEGIAGCHLKSGLPADGSYHEASAILAARELG
jgi:hypothetical protein